MSSQDVILFPCPLKGILYTGNGHKRTNLVMQLIAARKEKKTEERIIEEIKH
jgi:hypothetical protein